jgi:hypothetical protein
MLQKTKLYFLLGVRSNELITHQYEKHSARISHAKVQKKYGDPDFPLIEQLLGK